MVKYQTGEIARATVTFQGQLEPIHIGGAAYRERTGCVRAKLNQVGTRMGHGIKICRSDRGIIAGGTFLRVLAVSHGGGNS